MSVATKPKQWQSQAPANTMILGEHSVVYGHPALACAVNQYVTIHWQQRDDNALNIYSALGEHHTQIQQISTHPKLTFAMAALQAFQPHLKFGLDIKIESEFSSTIGLGSSAAVLAAMLQGLNTICQTNKQTVELFEIGHAIILEIQKRGSGTDLAASFAGGIIFYQPKSEQNNQPRPVIENIHHPLELVLIYSGYKTPTAEVLEKVANDWQSKPKQLEMLYRSMAKTTRSAYHAIQNGELDEFYQECKTYQKLMTQLGVNDKTLESIVQALNGCVDICAAKISGSGLGDCVLGIGHANNCSSSSQNELEHYQKISVEISKTGANCQQITN